MLEFIKSEKSYLFFKELDNIHKIFNSTYKAKHISGREKEELLDTINYNIVDDFFLELERLRLCITSNERLLFNELYLEIRDKTLEFISGIPFNKEISRIKYLDHFKSYASHTEFLVLMGQEVFKYKWNVHNKDNQWEEVIRTPYEQYEDWVNDKNSWIPSIVDNEIALNGICKFFDTTRNSINAENRFQGINLNKLNKQLNISLLIDNLSIDHLPSYQKKSSAKLFNGEIHYEALTWRGNLAELNKFIKSLYSFNVKANDSTSIEWKSFSKIFIVNNDFPDPDKLKGASNAKVGSARELHPFWQIVNNSIDKSLK